MKYRLSPLALALGVGFAVATNMAVAASMPAELNASASSSELDTLNLGTAYHSEKEGYYALQSVRGKVDETYGNTEMDFVVGVDMSYTQLSNMLDGNLGAALDVPVIKVDVGASYSKQNAADNYTGTYTLFLSLKPKKRLLVADPQTGYLPTQAAIDLVNENPGDKFNNVGNEFVSAMEYGSQVMVTLKFQYKNDEDKVKWGGQLGVDWAGKVSVSGKLQKVDSDVKRNIKVTVSALQLGGDPTQLLSVIPNQLVNCTMENPTPCFDVFKNTIDYVKTNYVKQFNALDDYNVTKVFTSNYKDSGPSLMSLVPEDTYPAKSILTKLAMKNMSDAWVAAILDNRRADNLINYYGSELNNQQRSAIEQIRDNALFNSFILADAVAYCKRNPIGSYCRTREVDTQSRLNQYDKKWLEL
ncbi:internalin (plasmid) [Pseudoalteromonas xiamenensis]|uniref:internalin n=1 Tax=Pseudoalteromonas xiamenensis TaxID=882626 RepID=UPI0027E54823|nr:internalin [Pseudoalteromonas xiamenensis]WMN61951.1 internalin [Pseudoalteromonas xiamenensis]